MEQAATDVLRGHVERLIGRKVKISVAHGVGEAAEVMDQHDVRLVAVEGFAVHEEAGPDDGFVIVLGNGKMRIHTKDIHLFREDEVGRLYIEGWAYRIWLEDELTFGTPES